MQRATEEDGPLVWFDHELVIPVGEDVVAQRERVSAHAQGLHESFRSFLEDLFTPSAP